jgi:uncharacterized protein YciI
MMRWGLWAALLLWAPVAAAADYDASMAKRLGADEMGMRSYVFVLLKAGPRPATTKQEQQTLFKGHMENIQRLAAEGKLVVAGPFGDNPQKFEGIFIFNLTKAEDVEPLLESDPAIAAGALAYEVYNWYGSAAVMEIPVIHPRISKTQP